MKGGKDMDNRNEELWQEINTAECDEASLFDICSWAEAN